LLLAAADITAGETWLPFSIDAVRLYQEPDSTGLWGYLVLRQGQTAAANRLVADAQLCDDTGQVLLEFVGLEARPASRQAVLRHLQADPTGLFYDLAWEPVAAQPLQPALHTDGPGQWLIFADRQGTAQRLAQQLRARGARCVLVAPGQGYGVLGPDYYHVNPTEPGDFQRLLHDNMGEEGRPYRGVVHLWSLDAPAPEEGDVSSLGLSACRSVLYLVQALSERGGVEPPCLTLVTRGARRVHQAFASLDIQQAGVWGLGRAVNLEHPELHCTCCDLDPEPDDTEAEALMALLQGRWDENQMALRQGTWYVPRLLRHSLPEPEARPAVRAEGTYLITGGTGGLGLAVAAHIVARGARHLVLVSRRGASESAMTAIGAMQRSGARVRVMRADVADRGDMAGVFAAIAAEMPPLCGVIHAAGSLEDGVLATQEWERFRAVFPAKVIGAWLLHEFTQGMGLDFFVLFSSAAAVLGNWGQGNYAAANAFLDELAHFRRHLGLTATSINWGPWDQVGLLTSRTAALEHLQKQGLVGLHTEQGVAALERILAANLTQVAVLQCDWPRYHAQLARPDALFSTLGHTTPPVPSTSQSRTPEVADRLRRASSAQKRAVLTDMVQDILLRLLSVSGAQTLDPAEPLMDQGLDSLMAVQFRAELGQALQQSFPVSLVFNYPTVNDIVDYLLDSLAVEGSPAGGPMSQAPAFHPAPPPAERRQDASPTPAGQQASTTAAARDVLAELEELLN
jgi:NAD(P)-dependent dehydrogenase (short-subunit alcohol dehydrogenase family)/acyl carrier protein